MSKIQPDITTQRRISKTLNDLMDTIFDYDQRKGLSRRLFQEYFELQDIWQNYPDSWEPQVLGMLSAGSVVQRGKAYNSFYRNLKDNLIDTEQELLAGWKKVPWIYCAFEVITVDQGALAQIRPIGAPPSQWPENPGWKEWFLYSPSVAENYRRGIRVFFAQLWYFRDCFQTYGAIIPFKSISEEDLLTYTAVVDTENREPAMVPLKGLYTPETSITKSAQRDPLVFLELFSYSEKPRIEMRHQEVGRYYSMVTMEQENLESQEFWMDQLGKGKLEITAMEFGNESASIQLNSLGPKGLPGAQILISYKDGYVFLEAMSREQYQQTQQGLMPILNFPPKPMISKSMAIAIAIEEIIGPQDRLSQIQDSLKSADQEDHQEESEELNMVISRLIYNHNQGIKESPQHIAQSLGVDINLVHQLSETLQDTLNDLPGEGSELNLPPVVLENLLGRGLPHIPGYMVLRENWSTQEKADLVTLIEDTPVMVFTRWALGSAATGTLKATKGGNVNRKALEEFADLSRTLPFFPDLEQTPRKESSWPVFHNLRMLLENAGILDLGKDRFVPGPNGKGLGDSKTLYFQLLNRMYTGHNWSSFTGFSEIPLAMERGNFLLYMIGLSEDYPKGDWINAEELIDQLQKSFPGQRDEINETIFMDMIIVFILFFAGPLGLVESRMSTGSEFSLEVRSTKLFDLVFSSSEWD